MVKIFPTTIPAAIPWLLDLIIFSDDSDSNNVKICTIADLIVAALAGANSDDLPEGTSNLYMSPIEQAKLAWIQPWAEVNQVNSVQWVQWAVVLDLDDIPDWVTRKAGDAAFSSTKDAELATAYSHSQQISGNPHNVTKWEVWLGSVENERQLSRTADNFSALPEKSDVQFHLDDLTVLQDSSDSENIKKVTNQTNLIWYAWYIQTRWSSINYNAFTISGSTTYHLNSIVTVGSTIYKCIVSHQSSGSFASDLASWYRVPIGWGGTGWNTISAGSGAPVGSWVNPWDLYVDITNGDLYYWDGATWNILSWGGGGWVNYDTSPTTGNKLVFSIGTGADTIEESLIEYDPNTNTVTFPNTLTVNFESDVNFTDNTVTFDNSTINNENWTTENYDNTTIINNNGGTINNDGTTINNDNVTENYTNSTVNYDATTNVDIVNLNVDNITINNPISWGGTVWDIKTVTTATYTALTTDDIVLADATSNAITIDLYTAAGNDKRKITIKKIDSSANAITIDWFTTQTIDGTLTKTLNTQYSVITLVNDGSNWFII